MMLIWRVGKGPYSGRWHITVRLVGGRNSIEAEVKDNGECLVYPLGSSLAKLNREHWETLGYMVKEL